MKGIKTYCALFTLIGIALLLNSCFTGIESTKEITYKESNETSGVKDEDETLLSDIKIVKIIDWQQGKKFFITDNQAKLILTPINGSTELNNIENKYCTYDGIKERQSIDSRIVCDLVFEIDGKKYVYRTDKTINELNSLANGLSIPFLIDTDLISSIRNRLLGNYYYIKTPIWYDDADKMFNGRKYIKVKVDMVSEGNKNYPVKVHFVDDKGKSGSIYMSAAGSSSSDYKNFSSLFAINDIKQKYPLIETDVWKLITEGNIKNGMTKDECQLSLGSPNTINRMPTSNGFVEQWLYKDGIYLMFLDGLLNQYRR